MSGDQIENVYIFVSDALRWDYLPDSIREMGSVVKTVTSSTLSPASFASILSGLYPKNHGVYTFSDKLDTDIGISEFKQSHNISFWQDHKSDAIFQVLNQTPTDRSKPSVESAEPPFICVERELATHAPYRTPSDSIKKSEGDAWEYLEKESSDLGSLRKKYEQAAVEAANRFQERVQYLRENDMLSSTLIIFTSDHGELLGEYCEFGHTLPLCPELIYVPTVIINPRDKEVSTDLFSHVDIVPTIADSLDYNSSTDFDGISVYDDQHRKTAISTLRLPPMTSTAGPISILSSNLFHVPEYTINSVWGKDGGWVFNDSSPLGKISYLMKSLVPSKRKRNVVTQEGKELGRLLRSITAKKLKYGDPSFISEEARDILANIGNTQMLAQTDGSLNEEQLEHLQDLGYR